MGKKKEKVYSKREEAKAQKVIFGILIGLIVLAVVAMIGVSI